MRRAIRLATVLVTAVAMFTVIAVPAQGKGGPPVPSIETFEVACPDPHWVTAAATADEDRRERVLVIYLLARIDIWPYLEQIDRDEAVGTGPLEVQVEGDVTGVGDGYYEVYATLTTLHASNRSDGEESSGYC